MINESIFGVHIIVVVMFTLLALRLGQSALSTTVCLYAILSNMLVTKQIAFLGFSVVSTDVFAVGCMLGLNLMQEYFGKESTRKTIKYSTIISLFYILITQIHLLYEPSRVDTMQQHFIAIFGSMPRIIMASIITYAVVQYGDAFLYGKIKSFFSGRFLVMRNIVTLSASQFFDTVLFSFLGLYGVVHAITPVIIMSFSIKMLVVLCAAPFIKISRYCVKS